MWHLELLEMKAEVVVVALLTSFLLKTGTSDSKKPALKTPEPALK